MKKLTLKKAERMMEENNGNLDLYGSDVEELPDNLTVGGWLDLRNTEITALPNNLYVKGNLYCNKDLMIPESVKVEGKIFKY